MVNCGYQVEVCGNPKEALKVLSENHFDLIVTDHEMPYLTGVEFVGKLRENKAYSKTPVIVLTSIKESIARKIYADIDIKEFMQKDNFEQSKFLSYISKYLNDKNS